MDEYKITSSTLMLENYAENKTKIYELEEDFIIEQSINSIVENSCSYYGSTLAGRVDASKKIIGTNIKLPIIIEDTKKILFFPTKANNNSECKWLSFNSIDKIEKVGKYKKATRIVFCNGKSIDVKVSYEIIKRQYYNSLILEKTLLLRQANA